jgi:hypothetical protein
VRSIAAREKHNFTDSGDLLWNKIVKLARCSPPLDALLLLDDQQSDALLLDNFLELGVTSLDGLDMNSGEVK